MEYETRTRSMLDRITEGSNWRNWNRYLHFHQIITYEAKKLRDKVMDLRKDASRAVLTAYTGSEQ